MPMMGKSSWNNNYYGHCDCNDNGTWYCYHYGPCYYPSFPYYCYCDIEECDICDLVPRICGYGSTPDPVGSGTVVGGNADTTYIYTDIFEYIPQKIYY